MVTISIGIYYFRFLHIIRNLGLRMYTIIDIETTGGSVNNGKITEVAIYLHDGKNVVEEFVSLINPEQFIPPYISQLTGITNEMVQDAPKFYEVAKQIVEITEGNIFVAHNAAFDYGFIKAEFENLGYTFTRETLCTVKLSRKLLPGYKSYSLGNICEILNISNDARHRAAGDALATVSLFEVLLRKGGGILLPLDGNKLFSADGIHGNLNIDKVNKLPHEVGVYYFYNDKGDLIYIGKSNNIRKRVLTHLGNSKTSKAIKMKRDIADVDYEITGNELVALLKESQEIKDNKPIYNKAQKKNKFYFGLFTFKDRKGYIRFNISRNDGRVTPLNSFDSEKEGKDFLFAKVDEYNLCQKLCGLANSVNACFQYQIKDCNGACIEEEKPEDYNKRALLLIESLAFKYEDFVLLEKGRDMNESAVVVVKEGLYKGYGFVDKMNSFNSLEDVLAQITLFDDNQDARAILNRYIKNNSEIKIITF